MIQQHCYTKTAHGIFSKAEGYDTVAYSQGLSKSFIEGHLHPLCRYQPSRTLQALRVPAEEFPRALAVAHLPEGQMILSQTTYVESDFSGRQSTFFAHNYILSRPDCLSSEKIGVMLYQVLFLTETEWDHLPELECLPLHDAKFETVSHLPFDEVRLQQLIWALSEAVAGSKKVYVILPDLEWVKPMLLWLYGQLSHDTALALGFITYSREPVKDEYLHLAFMDKGSLKLDDPEIVRDYIFDFDQGYFSLDLPEGLIK